LAHLRGLPIERLDLMGVTGLAPHLPALAELPRLRSLKLSCCSLGGAELAHLAGLIGLARLEIGFNPALTDADLARLAGLSRLQYLDLSGLEHSVTGAGFAHLAGLQELE